MYRTPSSFAQDLELNDEDASEWSEPHGKLKSTHICQFQHPLLLKPTILQRTEIVLMQVPEHKVVKNIINKWYHLLSTFKPGRNFGNNCNCGAKTLTREKYETIFYLSSAHRLCIPHVGRRRGDLPSYCTILMEQIIIMRDKLAVPSSLYDVKFDISKAGF